MKKLWKKNRILFVLFVILIICFITIVGISVTFFYSKNTSNYGDRLQDISSHPITDEFKTEYKEEMLKEKSIKKVNMKLLGRILYITLDFDDVITLENAKQLATNSLAKIDEDLINYYDIEFILKSETFTIIGAKNAIVDHISWNNNTPVSEE